MWTQEQRARQQKIERKIQRYPSDLTDVEWAAIQPLLPAPARRGRCRQCDMREVINALRCLVRAGCGWRMLPVHFGLWQTVYWWCRRLMRRMLFATLHDLTLMLDREHDGRSPCPSGGVLDSQSIKAPQAKQRGYDTAKKTTGRKRHIAVDAGGRLPMINLTAADVANSTGALPVLDALNERWPGTKHHFADGPYDRTALMDKAQMLDFMVQVVRRHKGQIGFAVLLRRWAMERTSGWMIRQHRLVRDYEQRLDASEAMVHIASGSLMRRRLCV